MLADNGLEATFELERSYPERNYCRAVQRDRLRLPQRVLLEEEGIWFTFEHGDGRPRAGPRRRLGARARRGHVPVRRRETRPRRPAARALVGEDAGADLGEGHAARSPLRSSRTRTLEGTATILPAVQAGQVTHRLRLRRQRGPGALRLPGRVRGALRRRGAGRSSSRLAQAPARAAALRMEAEAARAVVVAGGSTCARSPRASSFGLAGHGDGDGRYLVTCVEHAASQPAGANGAGGFSYENSFTAHPGRRAVPAAEHDAEPVVSGLQTRRRRRAGGLGDAHRPLRAREGAVPLGPRGQHDENSSRWIRVVSARRRRGRRLLAARGRRRGAGRVRAGRPRPALRARPRLQLATTGRRTTASQTRARPPSRRRTRRRGRACRACR